MPGRKGNKTSWREWADRTRGKIKVSETINRLTKFALGIADTVTCPECGHEFENVVNMSQPQVKAAQILLDKSLPTLTSADMNIRPEAPDPHDIWNALVGLVGEDKAVFIMANPNEPTEQDIETAQDESKVETLQ